MAGNSGYKIHGKRGAIYLGGIVGVGVKVTNRTEFSLNLNRDYVEATVFGDANKTYLVGLKDISGEYQGILDVSGDLLVGAIDLDSVPIYLYADDTTNNVTGAAILIASGPGLWDASITVAIADAVRVRGNFRASGSWAVALGYTESIGGGTV